MEDIKIWVESNKRKRRRDGAYIAGCCISLMIISVILILVR